MTHEIDQTAATDLGDRMLRLADRSMNARTDLLRAARTAADGETSFLRDLAGCEGIDLTVARAVRLGKEILARY